ncbi:MAG TPA: hypothetical protein VGJ09_07005, partial [Bryobacteraceae bacterium]
CVRGGALVAAVFVCVVVAAALAARKLYSSSPLAPWPEGMSRRGRWLLAIPALAAVLIVHEAGDFTFTGDGLFLWEFKARVALDNGGVPSPAYFTTSYLQDSHPSYPLCLPLAETWLYLCHGGVDQGAARALCAFLYLCICGALGSLAWRFTRNPALAAFAAAAPMGVPFLTHGPAGIFRGYVDYPLGACFAVALGWTLLARREDGQVPLAAAFAALLPWWKAEGAIFTAALGFAALVHFGLRGWRRTLLIIAPALLVAVAWKVAMHKAGTLPQDVFRPLSAATLVEGSTRLGVILPHFGKAVLMAKNWGLVWLCAACTLVQLAVQRRREAATWGVTLLLILAAFTLPYMLTLKDLEWHLFTSANRLLLQLVPMVILGAAIAAAQCRPRSMEASAGVDE